MKKLSDEEVMEKYDKEWSKNFDKEGKFIGLVSLPLFPSRESWLIEYRRLERLFNSSL